MHDFPSTTPRPCASHLSANIGAMKRANPETTKGRVVLFATPQATVMSLSRARTWLPYSSTTGYLQPLAENEQCWACPLELGDIESVEEAKNANIPVLAKLVDEGWDIVSPIPPAP